VRRRALVTGGAVRVGQAITLALALAGMDVAISYHHSGRAARRAGHGDPREHQQRHGLRSDAVRH